MSFSKTNKQAFEKQIERALVGRPVKSAMRLE